MSVEELKEKTERLKIENEQLATKLLHINFIDEDGEVLQLKTTKNEKTLDVFTRYARKQGTPFLLSHGIYLFTYHGKVIPLNVTIGSIGIVVGVDNIIYVATKVPQRAKFDHQVANIPWYVKNHPRYFINETIAINGSDGITGCTIEDYNRDTDSFILEDSEGTRQYDIDQFIILVQNYYSESNGFCRDINVYFGQYVSKYESQVKQLDNQGLDEPNAIILRMIKIRQQIHRLLNYIHEVKDQESWVEIEISIFDSFSDRLRKALSSLSDEMKRHVSNTSLHKVKKPLLDLEDVLLVKQWPNNDETLKPFWEKGIVRSYTEHEDIDGYGPRRVYSVEFDNGECRLDIEDYHVIPGKEFKFKIGKTIKNIVDEDSSDPWAREIGWYTVEFKGAEETFVHLSHALKAVMSGATMFFHRPQHLSMREDYQQSVLYLKIGVLQLMDRISDPIMRRIGDILLQPAENKLYEMEQEGLIWKEAYEHYNDHHTTQMRDGVYKLALLKQCKIFASVSIGVCFFLQYF